MGSAPKVSPPTPATIASARAYIAQTRGDIPSAIKYSQRKLSLLPEEDHYRRAGTTAMLGLSYFSSGDLKEAYRTFSDSMTVMKNIGYTDHTIGGAFFLADIRVIQGRLFDAASLYEQSSGSIFSLPTFGLLLYKIFFFFWLTKIFILPVACSYNS